MSDISSTQNIFPMVRQADEALTRWWVRYGVALMAGLLASLSVAPVHGWPVLLVSLSVLVFLVDATRHATRPVMDGALIGWLFGVGLCLPAYTWVANPFYVEAEKYAFLAPVAMFGMAALMALFVCFSIAVATRFWAHNWTRAVVLGAAWSAGELLRGYILTGFPWNLIVYSWTDQLAFVQLASVVGPYGLGLIFVVLCALPAVAIKPFADGTPPSATTPVLDRQPVRVLGAVIGGFVFVFAFGVLRVPMATPVADPDRTIVRVINPNVEQRLKFLPNGETRLFEQAVGLGQTAADSSVDIIVWPEATTSFDLSSSPVAMQYIGDMLGEDQVLLAGSSRVVFDPVDRRRFHNSLQVYDTNGALKDIYDKSHLVPFGEYVPIKWFFNTIGFEQLTRARGALTPGEGLRTLALEGAPSFSPLICYEAIFPGHVVGDRRPDFLLNVSDDSWFGKAWGPRQHFVSARMRTIEEGLPMVRSANQGVTAVIDPYGRIVRKLEPDEEGGITEAVPRPLSPTLYAMLGDWMSLLVLLAAGGLAWRFKP